MCMPFLLTTERYVSLPAGSSDESKLTGCLNWMQNRCMMADYTQAHSKNTIAKSLYDGRNVTLTFLTKTKRRKQWAKLKTVSVLTQQEDENGP